MPRRISQTSMHRDDPIDSGTLFEPQVIEILTALNSTPKPILHRDTVHSLKLPAVGTKRTFTTIVGTTFHSTKTSSVTGKKMPLVGDVIRNRWKIGKRLGSGGFGQIYEAFDKQENCQVAVKIESKDEPKLVLKMEAAVLRRMQGKDHSCKFYGYGRGPSYSYLVMTLCGKTISELRREAPQGYFSPGTAFRIALQAIVAIKDIHSAGFLHRDIKPSNLAIGLAEGTHRTVYLLDFGLARQFVNTEDGRHRSPRPTAGFRGTIRYASLTPHRSLEMSRVDDLWSVFYMLIEQLRGCLPWRKVKDRHIVRRLKEHLGNNYLIQGLPADLKTFVASLENTGYYDTPDYDGLCVCLSNILTSLRVRDRDPFDWEVDFKACRQPPINWSTDLSLMSPVPPVLQKSFRRPKPMIPTTIQNFHFPYPKMETSRSQDRFRLPQFSKEISVIKTSTESRTSTSPDFDAPRGSVTVSSSRRSASSVNTMYSYGDLSEITQQRHRDFQDFDDERDDNDQDDPQSHLRTRFHQNNFKNSYNKQISLDNAIYGRKLTERHVPLNFSPRFRRSSTVDSFPPPEIVYPK